METIMSQGQLRYPNKMLRREKIYNNFQKPFFRKFRKNYDSDQPNGKKKKKKALEYYSIYEIMSLSLKTRKSKRHSISF